MNMENYATKEWVKTVAIIILIIGFINFGKEYAILYQKYIIVRDKLEKFEKYNTSYSAPKPSKR